MGNKLEMCHELAKCVRIFFEPWEFGQQHRPKTHLRSGRGSNSPPPGSIVAVVVPTSPRQSRRRRSEARVTSGEEFFVTRG